MHQLAETWTAWTDEHYSDMRKVYDFSTVEMAWRVFQNVPKTSEINRKRSVRYFVKDIKPTAEAPRNAGGGKWRAWVPREEIDAVVERIFLAMIGAQLPVSVVGMVVTMKQTHGRVALWTSNCSPISPLPGKLEFVFQKHAY